mmetsp:Transcript_2400/g.4186  ORF Transcript_2400/g.4186 Transcript_2400/m.4186 type:complete len:220 (-) Transcript_2400:1672-2331(-)
METQFDRRAGQCGGRHSMEGIVRHFRSQPVEYGRRGGYVRQIVLLQQVQGDAEGESVRRSEGDVRGRGRPVRSVLDEKLRPGRHGPVQCVRRRQGVFGGRRSRILRRRPVRSFLHNSRRRRRRRRQSVGKSHARPGLLRSQLVPGRRRRAGGHPGRTRLHLSGLSRPNARVRIGNVRQSHRSRYVAGGVHAGECQSERRGGHPKKRVALLLRTDGNHGG